MKKERRSEEGKKREGERGKLTLLLEFSRDKLVSGDPDVLGRGLSLEADLVLVRLKERKGKERKDEKWSTRPSPRSSQANAELKG
jgi:hypothetical protein